MSIRLKPSFGLQNVDVLLESIMDAAVLLERSNENGKVSLPVLPASDHINDNIHFRSHRSC